MAYCQFAQSRPNALSALDLCSLQNLNNSGPIVKLPAADPTPSLGSGLHPPKTPNNSKPSIKLPGAHNYPPSSVNGDFHNRAFVDNGAVHWRRWGKEREEIWRGLHDLNENRYCCIELDCGGLLHHE